MVLQAIPARRPNRKEPKALNSFSPNFGVLGILIMLIYYFNQLMTAILKFSIAWPIFSLNFLDLAGLSMRYAE
jgi:hypothetical protein